MSVLQYLKVLNGHPCIAIIVVGLIASIATAHPGQRVWVDILAGKVVTYSGPYPPADPSQYHLTRVFTQPLVDEGENIWDSDFPGYQMVPGGHLTAGTKLSYNITGPLLWYNPGDATHCPFFESVAVHFASNPPVPQCAVTNGLIQTQYTSTGFVAGNVAFSYNGNPGDHNHLTYILLGDGANVGGGPDGIYALPLQLTVGGGSASETFHLLLGKNASSGDLAAAAGVILSPRVAPDLDCDGDVDLADLGLLTACRTGPAIPPSAPAPGLEYCARADFDHDHDVDQDDFGIYQRCFSGTAPADPGCH